MKKLRVFIFFLLLFGLLSFNLPLPLNETAASSSWLTGWNYRRPVTINNTNGGALTDYQISVDTNNSLYDESGLVGSWHMNEGSGTTVSDSSGDSNNGVYKKSALMFDGSGGYVDVPNSTSLQITGDMTIEFWAKPSNISSGRQNPACKAYGAEFCLTQETNGDLSYYHGSAGTMGSPYFSFSTSNIFTDNTLVHVAITRNMSTRTVVVYKNGVAVNSATWTSDKDPSVSSYDLKIGAGYVNAYDGVISEFRLYNTVLSSDEIDRHNHGDFSQDPTTNLQGLWYFNEGSGTTANDSSGNGNNGTLVNPSEWHDVTVNWDTPHCYSNSSTYNSGSYSCPSGTTQFKVYQYVATEHNYDYYYIYSNGSQLYKDSGCITGGSCGSGTCTAPDAGWSSTYTYSGPVSFKMTSDGSVTYYGVEIPKISCYAPSTLPTWTTSDFPASWATGKYGSALSFDGNSDYVEVASSGLVGNKPNSTIGAWINWDGTTGEKAIYSEDGSGGTDFHLRIIDGVPNFSIYYNGTWYKTNNSSAITQNEWHYIVGTLSSSAGMKIYVDGVEKGTNSNTSPSDNTLVDSVIGRYKQSGYNFPGDIDEVRVYNRALSASEIADYYNASKARLDYGDVRFTDSDGTTLLNYWMEKDGTFWAKVPSIPASSQKTIYMYYGNSGAESESNIKNTFIIGDDFNDNSMDTSWSTEDADLDSDTSFTETSRQMQIDAGGTDTWTSNDEYGSIYQSITGNFVADVKIISQEDTNAWAKAGIMIKNDMTNAGSSLGYSFTAVTPGNGWTFQYDSDDDGYLDSGIKSQVATSSYPTYIRVVKSSTTFTGYYSTDGVSWTQIGSSSISSASTTQDVGLSVTSHNSGTLCLVPFDNIFVRKYTSPEPTTQVGNEQLPNEPPAVSSVTDAPDPVQAGNSVSFSVSWSDPDSGDQTKIHICKTDSITGQTCDGGSWCDSGEFSSSSPSSCSYLTQTGDIGTQNYYAFVCDDDGAASTSTAGTFEVTTNTIPSIFSVTDAPDPVPVDSDILFRVNWSDPGDQTKIHICKTDSITGQTCDGGSWCDSAHFSTGSPTTCTYTIQSNDFGTQNYYAFVCDSVNHCSVSQAGTFEVIHFNEANSLVLATTTSSGVLVSSIIDTGVKNGASFNSLLWQGTLCDNCLVKFQVAFSNNSSGPWTYYGPTSTSDYYTPNPGVTMVLAKTGSASPQDNRYIRYKVYLEPYNSQSPRVDDIIINWSP